MIVRILIATTALSLLFLSACSMDYEEAEVAEDISEEVPNTVLHYFSQTIVRDGTPVYRVQAEKAETYNKKNTMILFNVLFQELNPEGEVITEGWAEEITFYTDTEDAELEGNIEFYSKAEEAAVRASFLEWDHGDKVLSGKDEEVVRLERKSGSVVSGTGFEAELKKKRVRFTGNVEGTYVDEEE
jgi:LPS export ABC transporter protein LptC